MAEKTPFSLPESLEALSTEDLAELRAEARAEIDEINSVEGDLTVEQLDRLEELLAADDTIAVRESAVAEETAALEARRAAVRERVADLNAGGAEVEPVEESVEEPAGVEVEPVEEPAEAEAAAEPVLAAGTRRPTIAAARSRAPKPAPAQKKETEPVSLVSITASANVPTFDSGQAIKDMSELTEAFLQRVQSFGGSNPKDMKAGVYKMSPRASKFGVATIRRNDRENVVDKEMSLEQQFAVIMNAGKLENGLQGLIAAGGWCAPSETIYELFSYHTSEGLLDIPEVTARRGGIQFTKGPDFMTIFGDANAGFTQTEAQAEAGAKKPCYALECPPFEEIRLDAIGFCATAPILTEAAYPELVRQVLDMLGTGHARRKSASTIARIVANISAGTGAKAPVTIAPVGAAGSQSGVADALAAGELRANQIRQSLAMSPNAVIEGMLPYWAYGVFRTELSRRLGLDSPFRISNADIDGYWAERNIRFQYVYDLQMLSSGAAGTPGGTAGWTVWPTTLETYMWPAGAFTRLVNDVISLNAVYDHDLLTGNEYTAAFVEEGMAVANTRGYGLKTTIALNPEGASGFPQIGAGAGVTFAAA